MPGNEPVQAGIGAEPDKSKRVGPRENVPEPRPIVAWLPACEGPRVPTALRAHVQAYLLVFRTNCTSVEGAYLIASGSPSIGSPPGT